MVYCHGDMFRHLLRRLLSLCENRSKNYLYFQCIVGSQTHLGFQNALKYRWLSDLFSQRALIWPNHHHHHHHHHMSDMELGHLLTRSGLTYLEVSSEVCHDSFCQLGNSVSLSWVVRHEAFCLHVVSSIWPNKGRNMSPWQYKCCVID